MSTNPEIFKALEPVLRLVDRCRCDNLKSALVGSKRKSSIKIKRLMCSCARDRDLGAWPRKTRHRARGPYGGWPPPISIGPGETYVHIAEAARCKRASTGHNSDPSH